MARKTKISWCTATWNCWTGCTKITSECTHCYAERWAKRTGRNFSKITRTADMTFYAPLRWKEPQFIFVESLGDFFHENVDTDWRDEVWDIIASKPTHTFIILTKRPQNIPAMLPRWDWPSAFQHVWFLVSAGTNESLAKFWPVLRDIPGLAVRGISMEPLLEYVGMAELTKLCLETVFPQWIIVGGESGPQRRRMDPVWSRLARDWCEAHSVPFFFKGHVGNVHTPENETLDGKVYHEYPR